jgi:SseB protein C-terminal domain
MRDPDFYMSSTESIALRDVRRCWRLKRLRSSAYGNDLLLTRIDPPIDEECNSSPRQDRDVVILTPGHMGEVLFPISTFPERPIKVYVIRSSASRFEDSDSVPDRDLQIAHWAELYPSEVEAWLGCTILQITQFNSRQYRSASIQPEFVGEYFGLDKLKNRLAEHFRSSRTVSAAYLAKAVYQNRYPRVLLALSDQNEPTEVMIKGLAAVIEKCLPLPERLKIIFLLDEEQERELRRVCSPFFQASVTLH